MRRIRKGADMSCPDTHIVLHVDFGWREFLVVGPAASGMYQPACDPFYQYIVVDSELDDSVEFCFPLAKHLVELRRKRLVRQST